MSDVAVIGPGSEVTMHFTLTLRDGTVAETSREGEPLQFQIGDGSLIAGLERALLGLASGAEQTVEIDPQDAFGFPDPANIHSMSCDDFSDDMLLEPGVIISFTTPAGDELPGTIVEVEDEQVLVDFNHPMGGHTMNFEVEILSVSAASDGAAE